MTRYGMLIDANTCTGCFACVYACKMQNATPSETYWCKVNKSEKGTYPDSELIILPHACMHCQNAPCVSVCPTAASHYNEDGLVMVDYDRCIGCQACVNACPYGARTLTKATLAEQPYFEGAEPTAYDLARADEFQKGTVSKCIMCYGRVKNGEEPACVQTCIARCRWFGDLDDPDSEINKMIKELDAKPLYEELGTKPSVYYAGVDDADWKLVGA